MLTPALEHPGALVSLKKVADVMGTKGNDRYSCFAIDLIVNDRTIAGVSKESVLWPEDRDDVYHPVR
jgi:hypothetical protein